MKNLLIATASVLGFAPAAIAGPYINIESNAGFVGVNGLDYVGNVTDASIGVEGEQGNTSWYFQAGPSLVAPDAGEVVVELSAKTGGSIDVSEKLALYGEISGISAERLEYVNMGLKAGLKYKL